MYDCKAPLSRFYYPDTRRIINAFIIIIIFVKISKPIYAKLLFHLKLSAAPHTDDDPYMSPILEFD